MFKGLLNIILHSSTGGLVFECLAALKVDMKSDYPHVKSSSDVKREKQKEVMDDHYDYSNDEVFSLELERSERGLGLALVDIRVSVRAADRTKT